MTHSDTILVAIFQVHLS